MGPPQFLINGNSHELLLPIITPSHFALSLTSPDLLYFLARCSKRTGIFGNHYLMALASGFVNVRHKRIPIYMSDLDILILRITWILSFPSPPITLKHHQSNIKVKTSLFLIAIVASLLPTTITIGVTVIPRKITGISPFVPTDITVLFWPTVHGLWHVTLSVHWERCLLCAMTCDIKKKCSLGQVFTQF